VYNDDSREREFKHKIYGSDAGFYAAQAAQKNIQSAGLQRDIEVRQVRVQELKNENGTLHGCITDGALVMINPPYGERVSQDKDVLRLYQDMGTALKHQFSGATAWVISSNEEALKCIGLRPAKRIHLVNGDLECLFNQYVLFKGDHKSWKKSL
jgi:putative N6-adenine-specific DNA methylase